ncbi:MAG: CPBP family intramembrane metalloprotease [Bacteroidales bacterium]|nr:CPBP family intramembrane metalloprotease [Bacteroidales bacterium]
MKKQKMNNKKKLGQRILNFSFTKILIGIIVCIGVVTLVQEGLKSLLESIAIDYEYEKLIISIVVAVSAIASYIVLYKFYEKRKITELSTNRLSRNLLLGVLIGVILQSLTIFVIYLYGGFSVVSVNSFIYLIPALTMAFNSAIFEEILFRGIIFRLIEEKLGSYIALAFSALIFGALHLSNPNSSIVGALGLSIQAGLLLGAAYIYSKNLWFPIALHFAWNFTQSGIFGASTSGRAISNSLLTTKIEGAELITGGQFGPEGSIQATLFCLIATVILLILSHRQNKIIKPYWTK